MTRALPSSRSVLNPALATLAFTAVHHAYGGVLYATPWRLHGAAAAVLVGGLLIALARARSRTAAFALAALVFAIPVAAIGAFEGVYNHLLKNVLFVAHAPRWLLLAMFPPPAYELPNDALFELSGIAQIVPAAFAAVAVVRFVDVLRHGAPACSRTVPLRCLITIAEQPIEIPDPTDLVHLQFRRFAGCPICHLHLRSFVRRRAELEAARVREVIVFHARADELRVHAGELPFAVIADPDKRLYREFGVTSARRALLDPRVWGTILVAVARSAVAIVRGGEHAPSLHPYGGRFGLPADFLIDPHGRVVACKYGVHADDQWSVDELLAAVRAV